MSFDTWLLLLSAGCAISLSPGVGAAATVNAGMRLGVLGVYTLIIGLQLGYLLYLVPVFAGFSQLLLGYPQLFTALKWMGAAYLAYLGITLMLSGKNPLATGKKLKRFADQPFMQGMMINAGNPKAALFMLSVLPHFTDFNAPLLPQMGIVAATLVGIDIIVMSGYALVGKTVIRFLDSGGTIKIINALFGVFFIMAAVAMGLFSEL